MLYVKGIQNPHLHSYWTMDELTGNAKNSIQNSGFDLTQAGTVPSASGIIKNARGPYSSSNYLYWTHAGSDFDNQVFGAELWFKSSDVGNYKGLIQKQSGLSNGWRFDIYTSKVRFYLLGGGSIETGAILSPNVWTHVWVGQIASSGSDNMRIYVNGSRSASGSGVSWNTSTSDLIIGIAIFYAMDTGLIDDIAYWNTMPSTWAEVENIITKRWNSGAGAPYKKMSGFFNFL